MAVVELLDPIISLQKRPLLLVFYNIILSVLWNHAKGGLKATPAGAPAVHDGFLGAGRRFNDGVEDREVTDETVRLKLLRLVAILGTFHSFNHHTWPTVSCGGRSIVSRPREDVRDGVMLVTDRPGSPC